jgi:hypothetical protein
MVAALEVETLRRSDEIGDSSFSASRSDERSVKIPWTKQRHIDACLCQVAGVSARAIESVSDRA